MKPEEALVSILQRQFILKIDDTYGDEAINDFKLCVSRLKQLFKAIDIFQYESILAFVGDFPEYQAVSKTMALDNIHSVSTKKLVVNFVDADTINVIQYDHFMSEELSDKTFVYRWCGSERQADQFYIKRSLYAFSNEETPSEGSFFAVRTYNDLDEALINYRDNVAISCKGKSLSESMTPTRLFFNPSPENKLQEALEEYLVYRLRNCTVKREHNVDDSHPVDIIVTWQGTNHIALIEIKWIGKSLNERGEIGVPYNETRANKGAAQLVGYIDNNKDSFPHHVTVGYLAVFDLRRKENNEPNALKISRVNADYFKEREINYNPQYETVRSDFKKPYRFFIKVSNNAYQD